MTRALSAIFAVSILISVCAAKSTSWTFSTVEGEDASSAHYYFYLVKNDSVERVRWVWNGGAQSPPTVTEYVLQPGKITVSHSAGSRREIPKLIAGKDAKLDRQQEYTLLTQGREETLTVKPGQHLTETQQTDFRNLKDLLASYRER